MRFYAGRELTFRSGVSKQMLLFFLFDLNESPGYLQHISLPIKCATPSEKQNYQSISQAHAKMILDTAQYECWNRGE